MRGPVCLFGENGAGKTNLLEAVSQISPGRGLRSASLGDLGYAGPGHTGKKPDWKIKTLIHDGMIDRDIYIRGEEDSAGRGRRIVELDGAVTPSGDLASLVRVVWLTPVMDRVFAGGAGDRRRFLDRQTFAHFPAHARAATSYERAMRERNALLERPGADPVWLDGLEARMAEHGAALAHYREAALKRLQLALDARPESAFPHAKLSLGHSFAFDARLDMSETIAAFANELADARRIDARAGRALKGPHRSDLHVVHTPTGMPAGDCSTGQQKALLIGLILANARALEEDNGAPPLVLLDEASAHLDPARRAALFDDLCDLKGQAWLTGTERGLFGAFGDRAQYILVQEGRAEQVL